MSKKKRDSEKAKELKRIARDCLEKIDNKTADIPTLIKLGEALKELDQANADPKRSGSWRIGLNPQEYGRRVQLGFIAARNEIFRKIREGEIPAENHAEAKEHLTIALRFIGLLSKNERVVKAGSFHTQEDRPENGYTIGVVYSNRIEGPQRISDKLYYMGIRRPPGPQHFNECDLIRECVLDAVSDIDKPRRTSRYKLELI